DLLALAPDVSVVATGSEPSLPPNGESDGVLARAAGLQVLPDIPGLDRPFVVSADDVLSGKTTPSGKVVLIDLNGHWEAAGTAEYLADRGCAVTVIANHAVGSDLEGGTRTLFYRRAAIKNIAMRGAALVTEIGDRRVEVVAIFSGNDA